MTHKLKPCPFCGNPNVEFKYNRGHGELHEYSFGNVLCRECGNISYWTLEHADDWTEASAYEYTLAAWNSRKWIYYDDDDDELYPLSSQ